MDSPLRPGEKNSCSSLTNFDFQERAVLLQNVPVLGLLQTMRIDNKTGKALSRLA